MKDKIIQVKYIPTGYVQSMTEKRVDEVMEVDPNNWEVVNGDYERKTEEEKPSLLEIMTEEVGKEELKPTKKKNKTEG